jgi:hypothetical protein
VVQVRQRVLILALLLLVPASARKFYPDDPLDRAPKPRRVEKALNRPISQTYDYFANTFAKQSVIHARATTTPAGDINTVDEVPDSAWFVNRHARQPLSLEALARGAGNEPPSTAAPWLVSAFKREGSSPGFVIRDAGGREYILKFDPPQYPELASAAEVIGSRFFHAMGYHVPESYIVRFATSQLKAAPGAVVELPGRRPRPMNDSDIRTFLRLETGERNGTHRAVAVRVLPGMLLGPFRFSGTRKDDPNDTVPHEHLRELRGLMIPSAWLNHTDINALNTLDALVDDGPLRYIRHYLIDFNAILGSDGTAAKSPRSGYENLLEPRKAALQMFTLGAWIPYWARTVYPDIAGVGRFQSRIFDPARWRSTYPVKPFEYARPDDTYWGAKLVMAFREPEIRAILSTGEYSDPQAIEWLTRCLMERREKIGKLYLERVLPIDYFSIRNQKLEFRDLSVENGFVPPRNYQYRWFRFDNEGEEPAVDEDDTRKEYLEERTAAIPQELVNAPAESYCGVEIHAGDTRLRVTVYFRKHAGRLRLAGVERYW